MGNYKKVTKSEGKGSKGILDFDVYKRNPFLEDINEGEGIVPKVKYLLGPEDRHSILVSRDTGEIHGSKVFMRTRKVDPESFTKVYVNMMQKWLELSRNEIGVLAYIMSVLKPNQDLIYFHYEDAMDFTGYSSRATVTKGLAGLLDRQFLARSKEKNWYFINVGILFNGDRLAFVDQYIKDPEKTPKELPNRNS